MREEKDFMGSVSIPRTALYGIQSWRAKQNFPDLTPFPIEWYKSLGQVKQAYYITCLSFISAIQKEGLQQKINIHLPEPSVLEEMIRSAEHISEGKYFDHFIVPGITGGAGTSINMNINEIIVNASLERMREAPGRYDLIDPYQDANIFQSTNDVVPSALKLAVMQLARELEEAINVLREKVEGVEQSSRNILRMGYTQMQAAVPTSWGKLFSTYSDALSRDWWRISRCQERIKVVNLGGSAVGTGLTVPRFVIMEVTQTLQRISGFPVTRSENLADTTANLDVFVEVNASLKSLGVNLEKMVSDIRLLAADIIGNPSLKIPASQVGSSIMPGKINPVIPEFVISAMQRVYANDSMITALAGKGCLELNAYIPALGCAMLESMRLLISSCHTLAFNLIEGLSIDPEVSVQALMSNPAVSTAIIPLVGYHQANQLAGLMMQKKIDIFMANEALQIIEPSILRQHLSPDKLLQLGYSLRDF